MLPRTSFRERLCRASVALALGIPAGASAQVATAPMLGEWRADAPIVLPWTHQRTLPVRIAIHAGDSVTGTVGDARLVGARLARFREEDARTLRWKTEYLIDANLSGPVIRAENIWRPSVQLLLDWRDDHFEGGLATSGWRVAAAEVKVVAATLVLARPLVTDVHRTNLNPSQP